MSQGALRDWGWRGGTGMVEEIGGERYLTIGEAAAQLRRHPRTVWRWTVEGRIEFHQPFVNGKILIPEAAVLSRLIPDP